VRSRGFAFRASSGTLRVRHRREGVFRESRLSLLFAFSGCAWRSPAERLRLLYTHATMELSD
jgi:hypothetical protein